MALRPISRMNDFRFPPDSWDVRGWKVRTAPDDKKVGQVDDMLLDASGQLRYLDVDLGFMKKHVLVPLERSRADREREAVWVEGVTKDRLEEAPEYVLEPETLDERYERRLDAYFGAHSAPAGTTADPRLSRREGPTEIAGDPTEPLELRRMSDLDDDYRVGGGDPRGWKVMTGEGETVGRVSELLVDPGDMKARFLDVAVDEKELDLEPVERHVLLPSEQVQLNRSSKKVVVTGLLASDLAGYPQYGGLPLARGHARDIHDYLDRAGTADERVADRPGESQDSTTGNSPARHFYSQGQNPQVQPIRED